MDKQKGFINIALIALVVVVVGVAGYIVLMKKASRGYFRINGIITKDTAKPYNISGCGYCFTSDDGKYNCVLMTGKKIPINSGGTKTAKDLDLYLNKKVVISAKKYQGVSTIKCPIGLDVDKIEAR